RADMSELRAYRSRSVRAAASSLVPARIGGKGEKRLHERTFDPFPVPVKGAPSVAVAGCETFQGSTGSVEVPVNGGASTVGVLMGDGDVVPDPFHSPPFQVERPEPTGSDPQGVERAEQVGSEAGFDRFAALDSSAGEACRLEDEHVPAALGEQVGG